MTKAELIKDMQAFSGTGFITRITLARYFGKKDPHYVDKYLDGVERVGKNYFIPDVAASIVAMKTVR
ncbi:MAG: hypothetical protein IKJ77_06260 [Firmicutes bacterium]|nr:hypothetical protein [Bacillota bacterium]